MLIGKGKVQDEPTMLPVWALGMLSCGVTHSFDVVQQVDDPVLTS